MTNFRMITRLILNLVRQLLGGIEDLTGELYFTNTNGASAPEPAEPAEKKADQLPHGVQSAPRHDGVVLEMAFEKPQVGFDIQLCRDLAFTVEPAF